MRFKPLIFLIFFYWQAFAQDNNIADQPLASVKSLQIYKENGRMGLQKNPRKLITPAIYDTLYNISDSRYVGKRFSATKQQSLWGMLNSSGEIILPFNYFTCEVLGDFVVLGSAKNNRIRQGLYDHNGQELITPKYDGIEISNNKIIAKLVNENIVFSLEGEKIEAFIADSIAFINENMLKVYVDGKVGLSSLDNSFNVPVDYAEIKLEGESVYAKNFPEWQVIQGYDTVQFYQSSIQEWGKHYITSTHGKSQAINNRKEKVSDTYDQISPISSSLAAVFQSKKWGVINESGSEIIPVNYAEIQYDKEYIAAKMISNKAKWIIFDLYGFPKTKLHYDSLKVMSEGRIPIMRKDRWGYLDRYGVEIIAPIFESAGEFQNGAAHVKFFGQSGLIDRSGKWILPPINKHIIAFNESVILTRGRDQYQVIDYTGNLIYFTGNSLSITSDGFEESDSTNQVVRKISWSGTILSDIYSGESIRTGGSGLTIFKAKGRYGFRDQEGRIIIANRYDEVKAFHQGMAAIKINNKWGFIDLDEIIRVQPRYDSVANFVNNVSIVRKEGLTGVIDKSGKIIIDLEYDQVLRLSNGKYRVSSNGLWGLMGEQGEVIIHPKYETLEPTNQGFYIIMRNGKYGTINEIGVSKIPLLYDLIQYNQLSKTLITKSSDKQEWAIIMKAHPVN